MKKLLDLAAAVAFLIALGIVGAVERTGDMRLAWWTLPCFAVMAVAAGVQDTEQTKKIIRELVLKTQKNAQ